MMTSSCETTRGIRVVVALVAAVRGGERTHRFAGSGSITCLFLYKLF
jgi:hypothetical protein